MILASAGRRIDALELTYPVFPLANVELVRTRLRALMQRESVTALVSSAACGADLLALEVACALGIRRRIVLPFHPQAFRATSVVDRPGTWGPIFDTLVAEAAGQGDLVNLGLSAGADEAYLHANEAIVRETLALRQSTGEEAAALLIWNEVSRGKDDITQNFADTARALGLRILIVSTL